MPEWLAVLTLIFGSGGLLTGLLAWRKDAKNGPVEISSGQVADAIAISEVAGSWAKYQDQKLKEQEERFKEQEARFRDYDARLAKQESGLKSLERRLSGWADWYRDLELRWSYHRRSDVPPSPPTVVQKDVEKEHNA